MFSVDIVLIIIMIIAIIYYSYKIIHCEKEYMSSIDIDNIMTTYKSLIESSNYNNDSNDEESDFGLIKKN